MQQTRRMNAYSRRPPSRRRGEARPEVSNSQLVVYNPANAPYSSRKAAVGASPKKKVRPENHNHHGHTNKTPSKQRMGSNNHREPRIRSGDVRETYKVLPIVIGTGSFGTVRSCIHRETKTKLAIKSISLKGGSKAAANVTLLRNEITLLQRVKHKHIVRMVDVVQDRDYIHLVMEQCRGGDLFDMAVDGNLTEGKTRKVVASLLDAIAYLHERNIVHRDLKAEHLMYVSKDRESAVKIIDFGVATTHRPGDAPLTAFAGSVRSMAPEVIQRSYGKECDLWSCGVITYFLLTKQMPFDAPSSDPKDIFPKIVKGIFYYPPWTEKGLSEESKDLIDRLIVVDPRKRLTAEQALRHPWIRNRRVGVEKKRRSISQTRPKRRQVQRY